MIYVGICDDEKEVLEDLTGRLADYGAQTGHAMTARSYASPEELLAGIREFGKCEIYILDVMMPGIGGIELGRQLRMQDEGAVIIYYTSSKEYAYEAYEVLAQRYLLKPASPESFAEVMDYALKYVEEDLAILAVNTSGGQRIVKCSDIEYIENAARMLHVSTVKGEMIVSKYLRQPFEVSMEELLQAPDFMQIHKSFIINLRHVKMYSTMQFTMESGRMIPVSKSRQMEVKRGYLKYLSEH